MTGVLAESATRPPFPSLAERVRRLVQRRETIRYLVSSQLKAGHRDKVLGHLWNLLDPLLFMGVYYVIFGVLFGQAGGDAGGFLLYLIVGVLGWRFFDGVVSQATMCVRGNRGLIHEISFPKAIFPISVLFARLYDFLWGLLVLLAVLLLVQPPTNLHILWLPIVLVLQVMFTLGAAFVVAYLGAFYADTANVVSVGMRLWFYGSPIFYYVAGRVPPRFQPYYFLNPVACFLQAYRSALIWGKMPELDLLLYAGGVSLAALLFGFAIFSRGEGRFAKYV